jgi:antitoxin (DNA-binding transcriptional repressor) of toxin-antitoxin stability system
MKTIDLATATRSISDYTDDLDDEPIILTAGDKPVAALVSLRHVDQESLALSTSQEFLRLMQAARDEVERGDVISLEDMKRELA